MAFDPRPEAAKPPDPLALLFDLDGTLIDTIELIVSAARHTFAEREGSIPTDAEWTAGIGIPLVAQFAPYALDEADMEALVTRYREFQYAHHDRLTRPYHGIPEILADLRARGHKMAVVTSKMDALARKSLAHVGLDIFIDEVIGCEATTKNKPDPEPVLLALDRLGTPPGRALFLGDSPFDIAAGNAAGVISVAALWGPFSRDALEPFSPHHFLTSPGEIPGLVERLSSNASI